MKFFLVLFWDVFENLPICLGLLIAVRLRLRHQSFLLALASLTAGTVLTSLLIYFIQGYRLSGVPELNHPPTLAAVLVNAAVFTGVGILIMLYCSAEVWWSNRKTDVVLGLLAGMVSALAQASFGWWVDVFQIPLHVIALALSGPVLLLGVRQLRDTHSWPLALTGMSACTAIASAVIITIDYRSF